jgi:hypothetical protein
VHSGVFDFFPICNLSFYQNHVHDDYYFLNENYIPNDIISFSFQKSANVPTLACRKRPVSSALSLQKEVGETSDKHGSYREKKLKNANVVSEPIPPLSSVCNESDEIKRQSSSYPEEKKKQGNAVLAPPSLQLTAGFLQLKVSSISQSSHFEQAPSQKIIIPSAPVAVPKCRQLQASMFGTFGQRRSLLQGPLSGMRSLNPQTVSCYF